MEHRWGVRRAVDLGVRICGEDETTAVGRLADISISGAYVRTSKTFGLTSRIYIEARANRSRAVVSEPLRLAGRVVRQEFMGIGIEWDDLGSEMLRRFMAHAMSMRRIGTGLTEERARDERCLVLMMHGLAGGRKQDLRS